MSKLSKMVNVYSQERQKEVDNLDYVDVLTHGYSILRSCHELIEELTDDEWTGLFCTVKAEFDSDGLVQRKCDVDVFLQLFDEYESAESDYEQFRVLVEIYRKAKEYKRREMRKKHLCCKSVSCTGGCEEKSAEFLPECSVQHEVQHCVHKVQQNVTKVQQVQHGNTKCFCCGELGHNKAQCPHRHSRCSVCSKIGHTEHTCWKKKKSRKCYCCGKVGHVKKQCRHVKDRCRRCGKVGHLQSQCYQPFQQPKPVEFEEKKMPSKHIARDQPDDVLKCLVVIANKALKQVEFPELFVDAFIKLFDYVVKLTREEYQCGYELVSEPNKVVSCGG